MTFLVNTGPQSPRPLLISMTRYIAARLTLGKYAMQYINTGDSDLSIHLFQAMHLNRDLDCIFSLVINKFLEY
jgi:hypothetical protein